MKPIYLLLTVLFCGLNYSVFGQGQENTTKRVTISDYYIQYGSFADRNSFGTLADFRALAPQSELLSGDFDDFYYSGINSPIHSVFSLMVGLRFSDKSKTVYRSNPQVRLGISYISGPGSESWYYRSERQPFDTLTSSQTGYVVYLDSVYQSNYLMGYYSEQLRFDGSVLFRTNTESRWSFYSGLGFTAGLSFNANSEIYYYESTRIEAVNSDGSYNQTFYLHQTTNRRDTERYRNSRNIGASVYVPLGIDFRLGKKHPLLRQVHLFYEPRPGISMVSFPEIGTITNSMIQHGLGLRVSWI